MGPTVNKAHQSQQTYLDQLQYSSVVSNRAKKVPSALTISPTWLDVQCTKNLGWQYINTWLIHGLILSISCLCHVFTIFMILNVSQALHVTLLFVLLPWHSFILNLTVVTRFYCCSHYPIVTAPAPAGGEGAGGLAPWRNSGPQPRGQAIFFLQRRI